MNIKDVWYGTELNRNSSWWRYTILGSLDHLQQISRVYDRGHATVNGTTTGVLVVRPNPDRLHELQPQIEQRDEVTAHDRTRPRNLTIQLWLSTASQYPVKIRTTRISRTGPLSGGKITEEFTYAYTYGPMTIDLPQNRTRNQSARPELDSIDDDE